MMGGKDIVQSVNIKAKMSHHQLNLTMSLSDHGFCRIKRLEVFLLPLGC